MKSTAYWFSNKKSFSKYKTYAILKIYIHKSVILILAITNLDLWVRFGSLSCSGQQNLQPRCLVFCSVS